MLDAKSGLIIVRFEALQQVEAPEAFGKQRQDTDIKESSVALRSVLKIVAGKSTPKITRDEMNHEIPLKRDVHSLRPLIGELHRKERRLRRDYVIRLRPTDSARVMDSQQQRQHCETPGA